MAQKISKEQKPFPHFSIRTLWGPEMLESQESLRGSLAVVIDVLAASTNLCSFLQSLPQELILVNDNNILTTLASRPGAIVIGDRLKHFHLPPVTTTFSNVPSDLEERGAFAAIRGKTVLYKTTNGTAMIEAVISRQAHPVIAASFVNLFAVRDFILQQKPERVTLIRAGENTFDDDWKTGEDEVCVEALEKLLKGKSVDWTDVSQKVKASVRKQYPKDYVKAGRILAQLDRDLELVLKFNSRNVVPFCVLQPDSLIRVNSI